MPDYAGSHLSSQGMSGQMSVQATHDAIAELPHRQGPRVIVIRSRDDAPLEERNISHSYTDQVRELGIITDGPFEPVSGTAGLRFLKGDHSTHLVLLCNEEGIRLKLPVNRRASVLFNALGMYTLRGDCVLLGYDPAVDGGDLTGLPPWATLDYVADKINELLGR